MGPGAIAGLEVGGAIANSIFGGIQQRRNLKLQNEYNVKAAAKQYQYDRMAWERTNEYNNPQNVMARYKAAGLNPNLIYGGGVGNTAGTAPSQKVAQKSFARPVPGELPNGVLSAYQNAELQKVQINNARLQGDILEKEKLIKSAEAQTAWSYYEGRGVGSFAKGQNEHIKYSWNFGTPYQPWTEWKAKGEMPEWKDQNYNRLMESQLNMRNAAVSSAYKRILEMDANIDLKRKQLEYYDFDKIFKFASPAVGLMKGISNKFVKGGIKNAKSAPTVKGISSKFNDWKTGKNLKYDLSKWE